MRRVFASAGAPESGTCKELCIGICGEKVCNNADRACRGGKTVEVLFRREQSFLNRSIAEIVSLQSF